MGRDSDPHRSSSGRHMALSLARSGATPPLAFTLWPWESCGASVASQMGHWKLTRAALWRMEQGKARLEAQKQSRELRGTGSQGLQMALAVVKARR